MTFGYQLGMPKVSINQLELDEMTHTSLLLWLQIPFADFITFFLQKFAKLAKKMKGKLKIPKSETILF